jgi:hypothetical protein
MGAASILNAGGANDVLNPEYGFPGYDSETVVTFKPRNGPPFIRRNSDGGRIFDFQWNSRLQSQRDALRQWERQYKYDFFSYFHVEENRYYSGRFTGFQEAPVGFDRWNIAARFEEMPGVPMFAYPTNWARDAIFIEERDGQGNDLVKLTGNWTFEGANGNAHGLANYLSAATNALAEWTYFGYGFRFWALKANEEGIVEISLDDVVLTTVDLYNAVTQVSAPLFTNSNVPLGEHRVKLRNTGTKNGASANFVVRADAIEVMV